MSRRIVLSLAAVFALLLASCGGDAAQETTSSTGPADTSTTSTTAAPESTTTTAEPAPTTTSSTTTTEPPSPPLAAEGDRNETVEAFQFLINCTSGTDLTVDGVFGPATRSAVEAARVDLGLPGGSTADEALLDALSRACSEPRRLEGDGEFVVVGNTSGDDPERVALALLSGSTVQLVVTPSALAEATLTAADGTELPADGSFWTIDETGDYAIEVLPRRDDSVTFTLSVDVIAGVRETGDWILDTNGITYRGTKLAIGADAATVIDSVFDFLGHGVRGPYDEFDTGWYAITDPLDMGLRGVFIEGLAFLFYGPDPNNPDRPETLARIRFEGPSDDAAGNPRPEDYVTTSEGVTVGDTLADLKAVYAGGVRAGSNDDEHYYRYADSGGELCFYFGPEAPGDFDPIVEITTECRS